MDRIEKRRFQDVVAVADSRKTGAFVGVQPLRSRDPMLRVSSGVTLDELSGYPATTRDGISGNATGAASVRVSVLKSGFSPRLNGEDPNHVQVLVDAEDPLPPILVHRASMRVIDGMHRLLAAIWRGQETILAEFFDGNEEDAYLLALKRNATHGYPLTLADRKAAVSRIVDAYPEWSDRVIAEATGISAKTVGAIRRRVAGAGGGSGTRLGKDGRVRPLDGAEGRLLASRLIESNPTAPVREIASKAGIAVSTAHDVRRRLRSGQSPLPAKSDHKGESKLAVPSPRSDPSIERRSRAESAVLLSDLKKDPSLRYNEVGRRLLLLLEANALCFDVKWEHLVEAVPERWLTAITGFADEYAAMWHALAKRLHRQQGDNDD